MKTRSAHPLLCFKKHLWTASLILTASCAIAGCDALTSPDPALALTLDGTEVRQTIIGDGLIHSGDYVVVDFFLTNTADSAYVNVASSVTSTDAVDALQSYAPTTSRRFDRIEAGASVRLVVEFRIRPNTPVGTVIPLTVTLTTQGGVATAVSASLTTSALPYSWAAEGIAVAQDTDGDGTVEAGEEATVRFTPRLTGEAVPPSACGEYRVTTSLAQVVLLGVINGSCGGGVERSFRFRASSTLSPGTPLPFTVTLSDRLGNTWTSDLSIPLG